MHTHLEIPETLEVICNCWDQAEEELRRLVKEKHPDLPEPMVTRLFYDYFRINLKDASGSRQVSLAFLEDLKLYFGIWEYTAELVDFAGELIAEVSLHNCRTEGRTGGDFGLTINRPWIPADFSSALARSYEVSCQQLGLLAQAKLRDSKGKWRRLTQAQEKVLEERKDFLALLLYEYHDAGREHLAPFRWQLCQGSAKPDIIAWTKSRGSFPGPISSRQLLLGLGGGTFGTDDAELIQQYIQPRSRPSFQIDIKWPDDKKPPSTLVLESVHTATERERQPLLQYVRNG